MGRLSSTFIAPLSSALHSAAGHRDIEFANRVIDKDKHKKECKRLLKENDDLAHLARSVMNEVTDLRTGIKTAKVVNKELYLENQTILGTTLQTVQGSPE